MFSTQINVSAQKKADLKLASSIEGYYSGFYISKKKIEKNTRTWRLFSHQEIIAEFARNGFELKQRKPQFFLPMVLHRALKSRSVSSALEGLFRGMGLTACFGSPVIAEFVRRPV